MEILYVKNPQFKIRSTAKYNQEDIQTIENVSSGKNAVDILLDEWGTSGRKRPTLQDLANILRTDEEFTRHSQFLNHELTRDSGPSNCKIFSCYFIS